MLKEKSWIQICNCCWQLSVPDPGRGGGGWHLTVLDSKMVGSIDGIADHQEKSLTVLLIIRKTRSDNKFIKLALSGGKEKGCRSWLGAKPSLILNEKKVGK